MRANVLLRRLETRPVECVAQQSVQDLGILEGWVRRLRRDEQSAGVALSFVSDVLDNRFARVRWKRHAVVQLALAADQDFARTPVDVVELDRNDLGSAKPEPRHEQQHRVVAPPNGVVRSDRFNEPSDLFGPEIARQVVRIGLGDARQAVGEIAPGLATPEQELEETAQMGRQRLVSTWQRSGLELTKEGDDIVRRDRVQVAQLVAEAKGQELLHIARAVVDRGLGQSALSAQVGLIFLTQTVQCGQLFRRRLRGSRDPSLDQVIDEPSQTEPGIGLSVASDSAQYRVPKELCRCTVEVADTKSAFLDCLAQPAGHLPVFMNRQWRVALRGEPFQKCVAMSPWPSSLISPFAARIPRECHMPLLSR